MRLSEITGENELILKLVDIQHDFETDYNSAKEIIDLANVQGALHTGEFYRVKSMPPWMQLKNL